MRNRWRWTRKLVASLLAISLLGLAPLALARDRCDRRYYNSDYGRDSRVYYDRQDYSYGYPYRDYGYRDYGYRDGGYYDGYYHRSAGRSAEIIGGSAAAGAAIGAAAGGGKGAAIGAAIGGIGGLIFDRSTRRDRDRW